MAIKKMMSSNLDLMRKNSRKYFDEHFDKQRLMDEMDTYLEVRDTVLL